MYLLTDGRPTDDTTAEVKRWKDHYASKVNLIAVGTGPSADLNILRQLTENVMLFTESQEGTLPASSNGSRPRLRRTAAASGTTNNLSSARLNT